MAKNITTIHKLLGSHIRELRNRKNYSIEKLAEKSELHPTYLGEIERATTNVSVATLEKIAKGSFSNAPRSSSRVAPSRLIQSPGTRCSSNMGSPSNSLS